MFAVAEGLLTGSAPGGKLRNVQERAAFVSGVGALSAVPGRSQGKVALAGRVVALLCSLYGCAFPPRANKPCLAPVTQCAKMNWSNLPSKCLDMPLCLF